MSSRDWSTARTLLFAVGFFGLLIAIGAIVGTVVK
jgi:hypothetical protein